MCTYIKKPIRVCKNFKVYNSNGFKELWKDKQRPGNLTYP